jgi:sulfoxide reductase heme-binding subunit YedZ
VTPAQRVNGWARALPTWPVYLAGALPPVWWFYQGLTGGLGAEPIKTFEHLLGTLALQMLIATLAVTPIRTWTGVNLVKFRRALGLLTFYYVACHLAVWLFLDVQALDKIWADIVKRPYITIGMIGFTLLIPLAATSNNWSIRRLGPPRWRRLHQLGYVAALLGAVHFVMLAKTWAAEPMMYLAVVLALLLTRIRLPQRASA